MPEELSQAVKDALVMEVADNLRIVHLFDMRKELVVGWDVGRLDGEGNFVQLRHVEHVFTEAEFDAIADGKDFLPRKTNCENIRNALYAVLRTAGKI